jgi:hypothetical protein
MKTSAFHRLATVATEKNSSSERKATISLTKLKWFANVQRPFSFFVPTFRSELRRVQIALDADFAAPLGKRQQSTHGRRSMMAVAASERGTVHEIHIPLSLHVSSSAFVVIWSRVSVCTQPEINRVGVLL